MYRALLPAVSIVLLLAACAGAGPTAAPIVTTAPATAPAASVASSTVSLASAGFFVGPNGKTLYIFDKDSLGKTVCVDDCLANWPPLTVTSAGAIVVSSGLLGADFATITRDDGTLQVTFRQIPLYYFAGDAAAGDTNGDGVGGVWHLATVESTLPPPAASTAPSAAASPTSAASLPAASEPAAATVSVNLSADGPFLVDGDGMSLYTFDNDSPGESSCDSDCAENWPPLAVANDDDLPNAGTDVTGTFAIIEREDGMYQVTYNDLPLYHYSGDEAAGDTNGDGLGDVWHLAAP